MSTQLINLLQRQKSIPTSFRTRIITDSPSYSERFRVARAPIFFIILTMNYTLWHLQQRVNKLIEQQGEDAHCAAWIYTKEDCFLTDDNGEQEYPCDKHPELAERIFNDVGNIDYIYTVIQECVDEVTEEQYMLLQQELVEVE